MLVFFAYAGSVALSVAQCSLCKYGGNKGDQDIFNVNKTVGASLMFLLMGVVLSLSFHLPTLLYSLAYAFFILISMWAGLKALASGPLAITSMIISFSLMIPCAFGIFVLGESLSVFGIIGLILLFSSLFVINAKKRSDKKANLKWFIFTVTTMISDGCCSIVKKLHQKAFPNSYMVEFMLYTMVIASLVFTVIMLCKHKPKTAKQLIDLNGILSGVANGGSCFVSLYLASVENLTVMSPVIAALTSLASLAAGKFLFKEKLTVLQIIGFCLGISSIILLKL